MIIAFASKGRASTEAASCLSRIEHRCVGVQATRSIASSIEEFDELPRGPDVAFAALGLEALLNIRVREASDVVVAVAEGGPRQVGELQALVVSANSEPGARVLMLGTGSHHGPEGCPTVALRQPFMLPSDAYARTLYVAILRAVAACAEYSPRDEESLETISIRMRWLSETRRRDGLSISVRSRSSYDAERRHATGGCR